MPSAARRVEHDLVTARMQRAMRELPHLDAVALCLAWRRSYLQLLDAGSTPDAAAAVVDHRQRILDEIERRDARGLGR